MNGSVFTNPLFVSTFENITVNKNHLLYISDSVMDITNSVPKDCINSYLNNL